MSEEFKKGFTLGGATGALITLLVFIVIYINSWDYHVEVARRHLHYADSVRIAKLQKDSTIWEATKLKDKKLLEADSILNNKE